MMTRKEIEAAMDAAARRFFESKDPEAQKELRRFAEQLAVIRHIETLENALANCRHTDVRTPQVYAALAFLGERASTRWPFDAFRNALYVENEEGLWQSLNAALNGIKRAVGLVDDEL